ncbi:methyltransferase domain-containing protein [Haloferula helveola]
MTDWDARWREGETPWDKGEPAPPLLECLDGPDGEFLAGARVLVPGCGSGHDVRALARAGATVTGLDLSPTALEVAQSFPEVGGETYLPGDFLEWHSECFDAVWEHTCFCAIDPADRGRYAAAASRLIRPAGRLVGVFYLTPWDPDEEPDGPPHASDRDEIVRHFSPWFSLIREKVPERAYPGREGREWLVAMERNTAEPGSCGRGAGGLS